MSATALRGPIPSEASTPRRALEQLRDDPAYQAFTLLRIAFTVAPIAIKPRYGAYLVAAWLGGIVVNLLSYSGYYDIALRDFGLMLGALTLARLASKFDPPGLGLRSRHEG
jgi:hypothetical protein